MKIKDARSLSQEAKETLRKRAVNAVLSGKKQYQVAEMFGVSRYAVIKWMAAYRSEGEEGLAARKKGPAKGHGKKLTNRQEKQLKKLIIGNNPDQLKLPFVLWTRDVVQELIKTRYGIRLGLSTVGNYLKKWGFTPQKPVKRAFEKSEAAVQKWLKETYPAIRKRAKAEGARIYWGDEMGLRSDHQAGRTYGLKGKTPVVRNTGQRFSVNMISAITNRGHLCFMVFEKSFRVKVFLSFLRRIRKHAKQKVFIIADGHPVHRANLVRDWLDKHQEDLELFFLPSYSPELNPDELFNQDVKSNALWSRRPRTKAELAADVRSYSWSTQKQPDIVKSYFKEKHVRYAA